MIRPDKIKTLQHRMKKLGIKESDISEKFMLPGSKGGQKADKTSSAVFLRHNPTGVEVKCSDTRQRETNRFLARRLLALKIEEKLTETSSRQRKIDKIRKQKAKRRKRALKKIT